jgi:hypothetical protein
MIHEKLSTIVRSCWRLTLAVGVLGVVGLVLSLLVTPPSDDLLSQEAGVDEAGWGNAAITVLEKNLSRMSPIRLANACGLGASSCFKCHNGKRAGAPTSQPWHQDHDRVNNSCAGCHGGNPRLMKEKISHKGMVADSLSQPDKFCFECHTGDDKNALLEKYVASKGGEK